MVGPARKREAVRHVEEVLEVSERRACGVIVQPRATQRYRGKQRGKDAALVVELRRISDVVFADDLGNVFVRCCGDVPPAGGCLLKPL